METRQIVEVLERQFPIETDDGQVTVEWVDEEPDVEGAKVFGTLRTIIWDRTGGNRTIADVRESRVYLGPVWAFEDEERWQAFVDGTRRRVEGISFAEVSEMFADDIVHAVQLADETRQTAEDFANWGDASRHSPAVELRGAIRRDESCNATDCAVAATESGDVIVTAWGDTLACWSLGADEPRWMERVDSPGAVELSPDGEQLLVVDEGAGDRRRMSIRRVEDGGLIERDPFPLVGSAFPADGPCHVGWAPEGHETSEGPEAGEGRGVCVYDGPPLERLQCVPTDIRYFGSFQGWAMDPSASFALVSSQATLFGWDVDAMETRWSFDYSEQHAFQGLGGYNAMFPNPDLVAVTSRYISPDADTGEETITETHLLETATGRMAAAIGPHASAAPIAFSSSGRHLAIPVDAADGGHEIAIHRLYRESLPNLDTERVAHLTLPADESIYGLAFPSDHTLAAASTDLETEASVKWFEFG